MCAAASRTVRDRGGVGLGQPGPHVGDGHGVPCRARGQAPGDGGGRRDRLDAADVAADAGVVGAAADPDVPDVARRAVGPVVQPALPRDQPAADARADLHEEQRGLVRGQRPGLAERAQVDVVLQDRRRRRTGCCSRADTG